MPTAAQAERLAFVCDGCGYGIVRAAPPERCPMCRGTQRWILDGARTALLRSHADSIEFGVRDRAEAMS